jgi:hypothetical protein
MNDNNSTYEEMLYQATLIVKECEQKLNGWYFSKEYIEEKLSTLNNLFSNLK